VAEAGGGIGLVLGKGEQGQEDRGERGGGRELKFERDEVGEVGGGGEAVTEEKLFVGLRTIRVEGLAAYEGWQWSQVNSCLKRNRVAS